MGFVKVEQFLYKYNEKPITWKLRKQVEIDPVHFLFCISSYADEIKALQSHLWNLFLGGLFKLLECTDRLQCESMKLIFIYVYA